MSGFLILLLIIAALLAFLYRDRIRERFFPGPGKNYTLDDRFNSEKREREKEIDRLLGKMGRNGIKDLSAKDRKRLDELSKK
ncbi:DUF6576 domain-containing protein [uncultured Chryseobacterium sp.]|uniref:DUF6576 domain-containing protein n=1 Tax=uncultured Chryseobacterium sp. TaxID=259322 RepID=UPI0025F74E88|nr:DUF6576 domain-containing protein [uncultured Chryseobacterium sp.]